MAEEFPERRKRENHALRRLYKRVETLEAELDTLRKLHALHGETIKANGDSAVTYKALIATVIGAALTLFGSAWKFSSGLQESTAAQVTGAVASQTAAISEQGRKLETFMERQAATNVKTEALYLRAVELKSPAEARAVVLQTAKEK